MKPITYALLAAAAACGMASAAETAYTTPVGYVSQTCLNASDTLVGLPLRTPTVAAAALTATPGANVLTVAGAAFGAFGGTHYVKFTSGSDSGKVFAISANDATTITLDLAGDTLTAVSTDKFSVSKFWTLAELFNPTLSTSSAATTGNAIVTSANATAGQRRTELLVPGSGVGVNLSAGAIYYVIAGTPNEWRRAGVAGSQNNFQLFPDSYFTIRNPSTVTAPTTYTIAGEVDTGNVVIPLATRNGGVNEKQDNAVALTRPIDVTLSGLNLGNTPAFVSSANATAGARRDELLVFNNAASGLNKSASSIYYFLGGVTNEWRKAGLGTNAGGDIIPAGSAILIRKFGTTGGVTSFWSNTSTY